MIYRSRQHDIDIPDVSVSAHVLARALDYPDKTALIDGVTGERITYANWTTCPRGRRLAYEMPASLPATSSR